MSETPPPAPTAAQVAELLRQLAPMLDSVARQIDVVQAHEGRIADLEATLQQELPKLRQQIQTTATQVVALEDQLAKMSEAAVFRLVDPERPA